MDEALRRKMSDELTTKFARAGVNMPTTAATIALGVFEQTIRVEEDERLAAETGDAIRRLDERIKQFGDERPR